MLLAASSPAVASYRNRVQCGKEQRDYSSKGGDRVFRGGGFLYAC
jgi:hypothetical protein